VFRKLGAYTHSYKNTYNVQTDIHIYIRISNTQAYKHACM
jgi:hypothetical protein